MAARKDNRTSEQELAVAVLRICVDAPGGRATTAWLKKQIPDYINLTAEDRAPSPTKPNEEVWEQIVRNIVSHRTTAGNIIAEGFADHSLGKIAITKAGRTHLRHMGY